MRIRTSRTIISLLLASAIAGGAMWCPGQTRPAKEITIPEFHVLNLKEGLAYHDSAQYLADVQAAMDEARQVCEKRKGDASAAIVIDLDETVLDNKEEYRAHHMNAEDGSWKWDKDTWDRYALKSEAKAIKPAVAFVRWAKKQGFTIFAITGRHEMLREATLLNLKKLDIPCDGLYMETNQIQPYKPEDFKTEFRRDIERKGYKIICNIGDQESDLYGLHSQECIKLPNKMYFTD